MGSGNILGQTNIPYVFATYSGKETDTANVYVNNRTNNRTIEVNVKKVPNDLVFTTNSLTGTELNYNGSTNANIDLRPIVLLGENEEPDFGENNLSQIFRRNTGENYTKAPFFISKEAKEAIEFDVDVPENNTRVESKQQFYSCFDESLQAFIIDAELTNIFMDKRTEGEEGEEEVVANALRIGVSKGAGTIILTTAYPVSSIQLTAEQWLSTSGDRDTNGKLVVNGVEQVVTDESTTYTFNFEKTSTITIQNAKIDPNTNYYRVWLTAISTGESGTVYVEKQLATLEDIPEVDTSDCVKYEITEEEKKAIIEVSDQNHTIQSSMECFEDDFGDDWIYWDYGINVDRLLVDDVAEVHNYVRTTRTFALQDLSTEYGRNAGIDYGSSYICVFNHNDGDFKEVNFEFPDKSNGDYTIATFDDAILRPLQNATFNYDRVNDETQMIFPKGILPKAYYNDGNGITIYFDYASLQLSIRNSNDEREVVGYIDRFGPSVIAIYENGELFKDSENDYIEADIFDGGPLNGFGCGFIDFYNVYNQEIPEPEYMVEKTWSQLNTLRAGNQLVPGQKYRITDYNCVVNTTASGDRPYVTSAGHRFDIIVTALTTNKLSEEAGATLHAGDTYFQNCNLNAWKLWYCLDNDYNRFGWAPYSNGKGVIYRMIDEFGNDCPYDFKNILFRKTIGGSQLDVYTFCRKTNQGIEDVTVKAYNYRYLYYDGCYDNVITGKFVGSTNTNMVINLPANVFYAYNTWSASNFTPGWTSNKLIESNNCIFLGLGHYRNIITKCSTISLSNDTSQGGCYDNNILESNSIQTGMNFQGNKIECSSSVSFGQSCYNNIIEYSSEIKFDNWNEYNSVSYKCYSVRFGPGASKNTVGANCSHIIIGGNSENNIIEGNVSYIGLGFDYNTQSSADISDGYIYNTKICSGIQYLKLLGDTTGSSSAILKNITVNCGITGTITATRTASYPEPAPVTYTASGATEIII